jgi:hypothetical protein
MSDTIIKGIADWDIFVSVEKNCRMRTSLLFASSGQKGERLPLGHFVLRTNLWRLQSETEYAAESPDCADDVRSRVVGSRWCPRIMTNLICHVFFLTPMEWRYSWSGGRTTKMLCSVVCPVPPNPKERSAAWQVAVVACVSCLAQLTHGWKP